MKRRTKPAKPRHIAPAADDTELDELVLTGTEPGDIPSEEQVETERNRLRRRREFSRTLQSTVYGLIVVAAVAALIATLVLPVLQVTGTSMSPTLENGDLVLAVKTKKFNTGDLIAFYWQNTLLLKRVVAGPGDYVNIDSAGNVYVNGELLEEPYVQARSLGQCDVEFPYQVPENRYFVLGDHRDTSVDSRSSMIGCVAVDQVVGRVFLRVWPLKEIAVVR